MSNSSKNIDSVTEPALSKEALELLEHIADILAGKFVEAIKKKTNKNEGQEP